MTLATPSVVRRFPGTLPRSGRRRPSVDRPADRDAQRAIGVDAHRLQHRRRLERLRRARRAGVHGDAVLVEREQDRLGLDAVDAEAQQVRERPPIADRRTARRPGPRRRPSRPRSMSARCAAASAATSTSAARGAEARPTRARSRSRPAAPAPARRRRATAATRRPAAHEQRARALRSAELVRGHRAEVGAERGEVDRDVTRRRARVDVHEHAALARRRAHLGHGLQRADLVVRELHADERGVGRAPRRPPRPRRTARAGRRRRPCTSAAGRVDRVAHARVLDRGRHDVSAHRPRAPARPRPRCSPPRCPTT